MLLPPSRPPRRHPWRGLLAFALALVGHGLFVVLMLVLSLVHFEEPHPQRRISQPVTLRTLSGEQWAKNRGTDQHLQPTANAKPAAETKKKPDEHKPEKKPQGQVVAVAPGNNQEDENAKYLAESSNKTAKETRAKQTTPFYRNAMPQRTSDHAQEALGQDAADKATVAGNNGLGTDDRPLREGGGKPVFEVPDVQEQQKIAMRDTGDTGPGKLVTNQEESEAVKGNGKRFKIQPGNQGTEEETSMGRTGEPGAQNLLPSRSVVDKIVGAPANDHLQDVDEGDGTYLNTKEWKYASFFNRVKQSVGMQWNPGAQLRMRDPTFTIYGGRDRYTVVNVTLTDNGHLKEIFVEKSCGLDFLDLEAVQAFERAQPFPNPPPGLVENDSKVRFQFGFYLEMSGSPRMRLFRNPN